MKNLNFVLLLMIGFYNNAFTQTCLPDGITFTTQAEIDNFSNNYAGCIEIIGNVLIESGTDITNLNGLNPLTKIDGTLTIENVNSLTNLSGLENLTNVHAVAFRSNDALTDLSGLNNLDSTFQVFFDENPSLVDISNLSSLNHLESIYLNNCDALTSLNGLENIDSKLKNITITNNDGLVEISDLSNATFAEQIFFKNNDALNSLVGLDNIDSISASLSIQDNESLVSLNGLNNVTFVGEYLTIEDCPLIENLSGLESLATVGNRLWIDSNQVLLNLTGLENLTTIGGSLTITDNTSLTNIEALGQLQSIGDGLNIGRNDGGGSPALLSLNGLENIIQINDNVNIEKCHSLIDLSGLDNLDSIGGVLNVRTNDMLRNLSGLQNLRYLGGKCWIQSNDSLNHIGAISNLDLSNIDDLKITNNQSLAICHEANICNYLSNGGNTLINYNSSGCADENEILTACDSSFGKIFTNVFYDEDQDKIKDIDEVFFPDVKLEIQPIGFDVFSNQSNGGIFYLENGDYTVHFDSSTQPSWALSTDSIDFHISVDNASDCDTVTFGFYPTEIISSMLSFLNAPPARCGEFITFVVSAKNVGTTITDGTIWLNVSPMIADEILIDVPDTIVGSNLYGWHFENLFPNHNLVKKIKLAIPIPPNVALGDALNFETYVEFEDVNGMNISSTFEYVTPVFCSFDPNDKLVHPNRSDNLTLFEEDLIYTIRFQNTGNDAAYDIIIRDTLDQNLDPSTFRVLGTSHPNILSTTLENDQFLTFNFENIYLPDSTTDFEASQGYVSYLIKTKEGLPEETLIENTASIYFDFNPPIVTNTTENIMVTEFESEQVFEIKGLEIQLFPNPAANEFFIKTKNPANLEFQITDINGRQIMQGKISDSIQEIDFSKMTAGIYFVKIQDARTHEFVVRKIVK